MLEVYWVFLLEAMFWSIYKTEARSHLVGMMSRLGWARTPSSIWDGIRRILMRTSSDDGLVFGLSRKMEGPPLAHAQQPHPNEDRPFDFFNSVSRDQS